MEGSELQRYSEAFVEVMSGKQNYSEKDASYSGMFIGYVDGVVDMSNDSGFLCIPIDVSRKELYAIVIKYIKNNPEKWNKSGAELVLDALTPVFSVRKNLKKSGESNCYK